MKLSLCTSYLHLLYAYYPEFHPVTTVGTIVDYGTKRSRNIVYKMIGEQSVLNRGY